MKRDYSNIKPFRILATFTAIAVALIVVFCYALPNDYDDSRRTTPIKRIRVVGGGGSLSSAYRFKDINDTQIVAAQHFGIVPLTKREDIDSILINQLKRVESSNYYRVDSLTHSVPYLIPSAERLLNTIAVNFQAKLQEKGLAQYQFIVTSLLRTTDDVRKLRRVNRNAVKQSCHMYGTTFDIAYNCFEKVDSLPDFTGDEATHKVLINTLGETLKELRDANRCYIKYERGQPCFHITTRE